MMPMKIAAMMFPSMRSRYPPAAFTQAVRPAAADRIRQSGKWRVLLPRGASKP